MTLKLLHEIMFATSYEFERPPALRPLPGAFFSDGKTTFQVPGRVSVTGLWVSV